MQDLVIFARQEAEAGVAAARPQAQLFSADSATFCLDRTLVFIHMYHS